MQPSGEFPGHNPDNQEETLLDSGLTGEKFGEMNEASAQRMFDSLGKSEQELVTTLALQFGGFCLGQALFARELSNIQADPDYDWGDKYAAHAQELHRSAVEARANDETEIEFFTRLARGEPFVQLVASFDKGRQNKGYHGSASLMAIHCIRNSGVILRLLYQDKLDAGEIDTPFGIRYQYEFRSRDEDERKEDCDLALERALAAAAS